MNNKKIILFQPTELCFSSAPVNINKAVELTVGLTASGSLFHFSVRALPSVWPPPSPTSWHPQSELIFFSGSKQNSKLSNKNRLFKSRGYITKQDSVVNEKITEFVPLSSIYKYSF